MDVKAMVVQEKPGKSRDMLPAAVLERDKTLEGTSNHTGHPVGAIHGWLARLEPGGLDHR